METLTASEAAKKFKVSIQTIYRQIQSGRKRGFRKEGKWYVQPSPQDEPDVEHFKPSVQPDEQHVEHLKEQVQHLKEQVTHADVEVQHLTERVKEQVDQIHHLKSSLPALSCRWNH